MGHRCRGCYRLLLGVVGWELFLVLDGAVNCFNRLLKISTFRLAYEATRPLAALPLFDERQHGGNGVLEFRDPANDDG
jgi:hypothetical protein